MPVIRIYRDCPITVVDIKIVHVIFQTQCSANISTTLGRKRKICIKYDFFDITACGNLSGPDNGRVVLSGTSDMAIYSCNNGFNLVGDTTRTCVSNNWTGTRPTCRIVGMSH